jgi:hypothetical protein
MSWEKRKSKCDLFNIFNNHYLIIEVLNVFPPFVLLSELYTSACISTSLQFDGTELFVFYLNALSQFRVECDW